MFPIFAGNSASTGYNLTRSLRFRASASAYLNRTPASAGNQNTWTWSGWVKRGALGSGQRIFGTSQTGTSDNNLGDFFFSSADKIGFFQYNAGTTYTDILSTQVFRDPSAWYHIVLAYDDTQATAANRVKIYVNGLQITAFGTASYPAQNFTGFFNGAQPHIIGRYTGAGSNLYYDGYLTEINFVNAQALTPSSFGSTNTLTGVWQPARYTGTYGTNGFYLPFTDNSALTTSSNVGLGKDFSGNGNYWTTNNVSITAGVTYDSMTDVPTLTSATAANFAVLNPLSSGATLNSGNLIATQPGGTTYYNAQATIALQGKMYFELLTAGAAGGGFCSLGVQSLSNAFFPTTGTNFVGYLANEAGLFDNGSTWFTYTNSVAVNTGVASGTGQWIGVAFDLATGKVWFSVSNTWVLSGDPATGANPACTLSTAFQYVPSVTLRNNRNVQINFGQQPFTYTPPTGFVALNTYNLPTSTIVKGNTVMDATLYTGTLLSNAITNAAAFKPDLVWVKSRSAATSHKLTDSVRGVTKGLISNTTGAETTDTQGLTAFGSAGFTVGTDTIYNNLAATYVGWQWQAGQGSTSSNTNGTITSTVSVNASAGFSVVTYTGNGINGATVGHGLGVAPSLIIIKARSLVSNWGVYHASVGNTAALSLDTTSAISTSALWFNNTSPTSSVFSLGTIAALNTSGATHVAYCWTPIAGFSAFGSYTGNGSTDGVFVYTGFRPRWIMIKRSDSAGNNWRIWDTARATYNAGLLALFPNVSDAEDSVTDTYDLVSNGFKLRTSGAGTNASGGTYIYAAFAENPFKNSLAR